MSKTYKYKNKKIHIKPHTNTCGMIDYHDIKRQLKRYSFSEKMRICNHYSSKLIDVKGNVDTEAMIEGIYPWELETFLIFSVMATPEYRMNNFKGSNEKHFIKIINGIRNCIPRKADAYSNSPAFVPVLLAATGSIQFDLQQEQYLKLYRANYLYNFSNSNINMRQIFIDKFHCNYDEVLGCCSFLVAIYGQKQFLDQGALEFLINTRFVNVFKLLSITIEEFKDRITKCTSDDEDYLTCLRPSYQFPFISTDTEVFIPLPHLIIRAGTDSLMYRITENDDKIRQLIGKEVLENYLFTLMKDSGVYSEVYPEQQYYKESRQEAKTVDVMAKYGDDYLFLDSKSSVASTDLRSYNLDAVENKAKQYAKMITQIYRQVTNDLKKYNESYNPFIGKPVIERDHIWAAVVVQKNSFIMERKIDEAVYNTLKIDYSTEEWSWIKMHIRIISFYDVERYSMVQQSLIPGFLSDFHLDIKAPNYCDAYNKFLDKIKINWLSTLQDLQENHLI